MQAIAESWNLVDVFKVEPDREGDIELMLEVYEIEGHSRLSQWAIVFPFPSAGLVWFGNDLDALKARVKKVVSGFSNPDAKDIEMRQYIGKVLDLNPPIAVL